MKATSRPSVKDLASFLPSGKGKPEPDGGDDGCGDSGADGRMATLKQLFAAFKADDERGAD